MSNSKKFGRWIVLDAIKALGVIFMVVLHVIIWWYIPLDYGSENVSGMFFFFLPFLKFIGLFVIIIPITAGASLRYFLGGDMHKFTTLKNEKFIHVVKRSVFLIILGYLVNLLTWGKGEFFDWDVLQFIGVSFVVLLIIVRFFPIWFLWVPLAAVLFLAPLMRVVLNSFNLNYFAAVLVGNNEGSFFWPFFPWFSFIVYGFLVSHYILTCVNKKKIYFVLQISSLIILVYALYNSSLFVSDDIRNIWGPGVFQAPALTLLADIGVFNLLLIFADVLIKIKTSVFGIFNTFSKGILWIYVLHIPVGYHLVNFMQNYISTGLYSMFFAIAFLLFMSYGIGAFVVWIKKRKYSLIINH